MKHFFFFVSLTTTITTFSFIEYSHALVIIFIHFRIINSFYLIRNKRGLCYSIIEQDIQDRLKKSHSFYRTIQL